MHPLARAIVPRRPRSRTLRGRLAGFLGRVERGWLWTSATAILVAAVGEAARRSEFPGKDWWTASSPPTIVVLAAGIVGAAALFYRNVRLEALVKVSERADYLDLYCRALLAVVAEEAQPEIGATRLAVHVWRVRDLDKPTERLDRIATYKVSLRRQTDIDWTKGKGVVGLCWSSRAPLAVDLTGMRGVADQGPAAFGALDPKARLGLSWDEFQRTRHYTAVYATPLSDTDGRFVGCLSVDTTEEDAYRRITPLVEKGTIQNYVSLIAATASEL